MKIAVDFGTTNTVVARWGEGEKSAGESAELLTIPNLTIPPEATRPYHCQLLPGEGVITLQLIGVLPE